MAMGAMQYMSYLIMLSICIDSGDGRWKERDKTKARREVYYMKRMADKTGADTHALERYDEYNYYLRDWHKRQIANNQRNTYLTKVLYQNAKTKKKDNNYDQIFSYFDDDETVDLDPTKKPNVSKNDNIKMNTLSDWPKFEDLLLNFGKKYDWKNDRWIKLNKNKHVQKKKISDNKKQNEKHKFSYRVVKLKSKSRRNVVVAVSAVR